MQTYRIEVFARESGPPSSDGHAVLARLREGGLAGVRSVTVHPLYFLDGALDAAIVERIAAELLCDPVTQRAELSTKATFVPPGGDDVSFEIHPRPGVMDPVALSTLRELRDEGHDVQAVRTARRYTLHGDADAARALDVARRVLANDCIEELVPGTAGVRAAPRPPEADAALRHIALRNLDDDALQALSRDAHLFLSLDEMRAIQAHYRSLEREPTDLELETLAQTWSEHCVHKTLKSEVEYVGDPMPDGPTAATGSGSTHAQGPPLPSTGPLCADDGVADMGRSTRRYENLLRDTIVRATHTLTAQGRGPECLSVFRDNAGVIALDDEYGVAFKVETHNHPSAIEPYGGAATGVGGVIRDVIGCGLGARPIANTNVFCVAPGDWPQEHVPRGVLHPARVLRGVVQGVADYGNRMGIPTVNGAVYFDPRYLGNPLVFCGCVGLIPRDRIAKGARPGDWIVVIGGRTGRDGVHGATFSSAELTDTHADEFSHAVQIGNPIEEKRFLDAVLQARDADGACLYSAITDCGAGGLSSAVGEMGEEVGAVVNLEAVPLKYAGLRYDEIWISEAQERMVVAVPPANLERFLAILRDEEVEATVIGRFGFTAGGEPRLEVRFGGRVVGDLSMSFLHHGLPRVRRRAEWRASPRGDAAVQGPAEPHPLARLKDMLARADVASKAWIIRKYDHEVQGGSVVKPLVGPGRGPADAAVLRPRLEKRRGVAIACGLAPHLAEVDPYWMAAASIDEAIRNVVCVGGDLGRTALLDNFCWGRPDDSSQLGGLVRACQACHDAAIAYGAPFISGKDSLNNEFALDPGDADALARMLERAAAPWRGERWGAVLPGVASRLRAQRRLAIPPTLLISAISVVEDVERCVTPDLKAEGDIIILVGGLPATGFALEVAARIHRSVGEAIQSGLVRACHDVSDGGWLTALAEMAIAGCRGGRIDADARLPLGPFDEACATYLVETSDAEDTLRHFGDHSVFAWPVARVDERQAIEWGRASAELGSLRTAWSAA